MRTYSGLAPRAIQTRLLDSCLLEAKFSFSRRYKRALASVIEAMRAYGKIVIRINPVLYIWGSLAINSDPLVNLKAMV